MNSESFSKDALLHHARQAGAIACGISPCQPVDRAVLATFRNWFESGCHATMDYMTRYLDLRANPAGLLPGARSVISFAFPYYHPSAPGSSDVIFARYSLGDDYHDVLRNRLTSVASWIQSVCGGETRICVDTAPIFERYWAQRAGIGFIGLNGLLIVPGVGSWVLLAEIITTAQLPPDVPSSQSCGECRRCINACPGNAIRPDRTIDARRCRSFLTIENRDPALPADVSLGRRIYGCDTCQEVCPWNSHPATTKIQELHPRPEILSLTRRDILAMDQERFSLIFRKTAIKRAKLTGLHRNASHPSICILPGL